MVVRVRRWRSAGFLLACLCASPVACGGAGAREGDGDEQTDDYGGVATQATRCRFTATSKSGVNVALQAPAATPSVRGPCSVDATYLPESNETAVTIRGGEQDPVSGDIADGLLTTRFAGKPRNTSFDGGETYGWYNVGPEREWSCESDDYAARATLTNFKLTYSRPDGTGDFYDVHGSMRVVCMGYGGDVLLGALPELGELVIEAEF